MLEALRITADWLKRPEEGVNAHLVAVPRDVGDPAPPAIADVLDATRTPWVARGVIPRTLEPLPLIVVTVATPAAEHDPSVKTASNGARVVDGHLTVAVQYLTRAVNTAAGATAAHYTMRAVRGALLGLAAQPLRSRTRSGVQLVQLLQLKLVHYEEKDDVGVTSVALATWSTRETTALAAFPPPPA